MKRFLLASILSSLLFQQSATAATCERRLTVSHGLTAQDQVRVLRQLVMNGCELIAVRFSERSSRRDVIQSQVVLDLVEESLVRVINYRGQRRIFAWRGVDRGSLLAVQESLGFGNFAFQGETSHRVFSDGALQLLR
jgi:hypothetical protein